MVPDETGSTTTGGTPATKRVSNVRAVPDLRTPTAQHRDLVLATERVLKELNIALTHTAPSSLLQDVGGSNSTRTTTRHHGPRHGPQHPPDDGGHVINVVYTSDLMCTFRIGHTTTFGELANDVRKYFSIPYEVRFVLVDNLGVMNTPRALIASRQQRDATENDDDHGGTREENGTVTHETYFVKISKDTDERFDTLRQYRPEIYHVDNGRNGEGHVCVLFLCCIVQSFYRPVLTVAVDVDC